MSLNKLIEDQGKQATNGNGDEKQPSAKFWLNIGVRLSDGTFISLPVGIAIDSQLEKLAQIEAKKPAGSEKMKQLRKFQTELCESLNTVAAQVAAGTGQEFVEFPNGLRLGFEIRHVSDGEKVETQPTSLGLMTPKK